MPLLFAAPTPGQDFGARPGAGPSIRAEFGFGGRFRGEHWGPLTVYVEAGDAPVGGFIVTEYVQDATQSARLVTPFAATPGKQTPLQVVAALPAYGDRVTVSAVSETGRTLARLTHATAPGPREALMPQALDPSAGLLVTVGRASLDDAARAWGRPGPGQPGVDRLSRMAVNPAVGWTYPELTEDDLQASWRKAVSAVIQPEAMPLSWTAYDGVLALVVTAEAGAAADPRAVQAVRDWVWAGGRLVILAHAPGPAWRNWLPDGEGGDLIEVGVPATLPLPPEVAEVVRAEGRRSADRLPGEEPEPDKEDPDQAVAPPGESVVSRPITLTRRGRAEGWTLRWLRADGAPGALAEGPVGFGWVTVLGLEPRNTPATLSTRASGAVWRDALTPAARDWLETAALGSLAPWGVSSPSAPLRALAPVVERVGRVSAADDTLFYAIAGAMVVLALLVGPVDYFVLGRLGAAQRSWFTALLWIGAASAAAYATPFTLRSGPTLVNRVTALDAFSVAARGVQTGVTGIFASQAGRARVLNPDQSSWWRGVSPLAYYGGSPGLGATVEFAQDAAGGGSGRGNPLERLAVGLWTFRVLLDYSRPAHGLSAALERDGDAWTVRLEGLPPGVGVDDAALRVGDRWLLTRRPPTPAPEPDGGVPSLERRLARPPEPAALSRPGPPGPVGAMDGGVWTARFGVAAEVTPAPWLAPGFTPTERLNAGQVIETDRPGLVLHLPGADRRGLPLEARLRSGRWAALYLSLRDLPPDVRLDWFAAYERAGVVRLLIPLPESEAAP